MTPPRLEHIRFEDLVLFADRKASDELAIRIKAHVKECSGCLETLTLLMEAGDLYSIRTESTPSTPPQSSWASLSGIVGAIGAAGLAGAESLFGAPEHHVPGYAQDAENISAHPVSKPIIDMTHGVEEHSMPPGFTEPEKHFGHPASTETSEYIHQNYPDTCAVQCQHLVLNEFGIPATEDQLVREATTRGIYHPGSGTSPADVGKLLEAHGLEIHRYSHANQFNLANELAQGHKVIVGVESGKLWHDHPVRDDIASHLHIGHADHAVIVCGIDTTDPDHVKVLITDPGTGDVAKAYPLEQFLDAWHGSDFFMVATSDPVPPTAKEMVHFDYNTGHLPFIGEAPFSFVQEISQALAHETNHGLIDRLEHVFHSAIHGEHAFTETWNHAIDHGHWSPMDLAHDLMDAVRGVASAGVFVSLLDPIFDHSADSHFDAHDHGLDHGHDDPFHH